MRANNSYVVRVRLTLSLALLAAPAAAAPSKTDAPASDDAQRRDAEKRQVAGSVLGQLVLPTTRMASGLADAMADYAGARSWALWDLMNGLKKQREAGQAPAPDPLALETVLRLAMRTNSAELRGKALPDDGAYAAAAVSAAKKIAAYLARSGRGDLLGRFHVKAVEKIAEDARKAMVRALPPGAESTSWDHTGDPIPMTALEESYLARLEADGRPRRRKMPPWPGASGLGPR
jgi:hypothetical protein